MSSGIKFNDVDLFCVVFGMEPLGAREPTTGSTQLVCSYCGVEVDPLRATQGIARQTQTVYVRGLTEDVKGTPNGFTERVVVSGKEVVACPDHCLNIGPKYRKCKKCKGKNPEKFFCLECKGSGDGDMITQGTKFGDFD